MGVPFEALLPYGIIIGLFGVTGVGLSTVKYYSNGRKNPRRGLDAWDQTNCFNSKLLNFLVMERDLRLTGQMRGQTSNHAAPPGFAYSNPWKLEPRIN
ncbi:conserved hypothetical protein [Microsporum canis CBS 113480]|uniref:NADH dehydrogenase [ubiquinone] 1 alpha subcomplex subunit 1 n=1 Tax=Arthroderma otae (strain ATCC MYA-4605 / CBS 113480) TaxID=554155 RepID=C5FUI5_ARTOC|nr:conserved hypothetical protein [Microsporum canis CBS 113480]EEQ33569.1 conserved hypothetical protein [Microsporum canis CBS 113480]